MMSTDVPPPPVTEGYNRRSGKVPERLGKALKWSESHGYRWLRIALCLVLIVLLPKGYTDLGTLLNQVNHAKDQPPPQSQYTVLLDFEKAVKEGHYTLLSGNDMQLCLYLRPPPHFFSTPATPQPAVTPHPAVNASAPGGKTGEGEMLSTPSPAQ